MILQRYIAMTVLIATLLVVLVVGGLTYFMTFLGELKDIGVGEYGILQAAIHALLALPHHIYQFFPMLVLLGGLMGLGMLASSQELTVMRISGISIVRIARATFLAALALIVIGLLMGEVLGPRLEYLANQHKSIAQSGGQAVSTLSGVWVHEGNDFFHIDHVVSSHHLEGVTRYAFDDAHKLQAAYYVESMDHVNGKWNLEDVVKTIFLSDETRHEEIPTMTWDITLNPNLLNIGLVEPDEMSLRHVWMHAQHLVKNGLQSAEFQFNFWERILQPLAIIVMLMLAIPFVFASPRTVSMGFRVVVGVMVGFTFYISSALLGQMSIVFQLSPFLAAFIPIILFAGVGYWMLLRIR